MSRRTELRGAPQRTARRLAREAADRTWSALTRLRAKVGAARFRDLMVDLPDALDEIGSPDLGAVAEFHDLLGGDQFRDFLVEITDTLEASRNPDMLWARWIDVVCERLARENDGAKGTA